MPTKLELTATLRSVFLEYGYDGASLSRLAAAANLSKASLYHHFPGGKGEIANLLIRDAVQALQTQVFGALTNPVSGKSQDKRAQAAKDSLAEVITQFEDYAQPGQCVLALIAQENPPELDRLALAELFRTWRAGLAQRYEEIGLKPKAAGRAATELMNQLWGALLMARCMDEPKLIRQTTKRLRNTL